MGAYASTAFEYLFPAAPHHEAESPLRQVEKRTATFPATTTQCVATLPIWGEKSQPRTVQFEGTWIYCAIEDVMKLRFESTLPPRFTFSARFKLGEPVLGKLLTPFLRETILCSGVYGADRTRFYFCNNPEMMVSVVTLPNQALPLRR